MDKSFKTLKLSKVVHPTLGLTLLLPPDKDQEYLNAAVNYKAQPDDVFVCSYPKCGTSWVQNIVWLITRYGEPLPPKTKLHEVSPCLEFQRSKFVVPRENSMLQRIIKTHLPYQFLSQNKEAKYIYITRNIKDTFVSYYFHVKGFAVLFDCEELKIKDLLDAYVKGEVEFCDFFDHIGAWYQKRNEPNVLFLLYEDLKKDPESNILKIAHFLGRDYETSILAEDQRILRRIIHLSSFEEMKSRTETWHAPQRAVNYPFIRKGEIGDWRNYLTSQQSDIIDQWMREKGAPYGVDNLWKDHPEVK